MPHRSFLAAIFCALMVTSASAANVYPMPPKAERGLAGVASYYGKAFNNRPTACGGVFNMYAMTAAHRTLPCGTKVLVIRVPPEKYDGRSAIVTITDRGPFVPGRIIDVSKRAAEALGFVNDGTAKVLLRVLH